MINHINRAGYCDVQLEAFVWERYTEFTKVWVHWLIHSGAKCIYVYFDLLSKTNLLEK